MLKKLIILFIAIVPFTLVAQESKIAYINTQAIFVAMPEYAEFQAKLKTESDKIEKNANALETEYMTKAEEFQNSSEEPTQALVMDRQKQLQQIEERYQAYIQNSQREMQELQQRLVAPIQEKLQKAIREVGEENGFMYILESQAILYHSPTAVNANPLVRTKLGIN